MITDVEACNSHYCWNSSSLLLTCFVQPRASRDEIVGIHDHQLKIRLTSPPVDGKANAQLILFLSKQFGVAKNRIQLVSGESSRRKTLKIDAPARLPAGALIRRSEEDIQV